MRGKCHELFDIPHFSDEKLPILPCQEPGKMPHLALDEPEVPIMKPGTRKPSRFTQRDVTRAFRAAEAAGRDVQVEISRDGLMRIIPMIQHNPVESDAILAKLK